MLQNVFDKNSRKIRNQGEKSGIFWQNVLSYNILPFVPLDVASAITWLSASADFLSIVPPVKSRQNEFLKKSLGTPTNRNRDREQAAGQSPAFASYI